jgi:predicted nucleotidyltransferase
MIQHQNTQLNIFNQLERSGFKFILTGSRHFGTATEGSDWDFFVKWDRLLPEFLENLGFDRETMSYRGDVLTTDVWAHDSGVHVQVLASWDFADKLKAQALLSLPEGRVLLSNKAIAKQVWAFAIAVVRFNAVKEF